MCRYLDEFELMAVLIEQAQDAMKLCLKQFDMVEEVNFRVLEG